MKVRYLFVAVLLAFSLLASRARAEDTFTIAVVPDTQQEVLKEGDMRYRDRLQWLVDNRAALNLKMVLHSGDMMNWDTPDHIQYERSSIGIKVLDDAGVPYALAIGNHDSAATKEGGSAAPGNVRNNLRNTSTFNRYFPVTRQKSISGVFEPGKADNAYHTFRAGGLDWLVMNLELWPRAEAVDWARVVALEHPNHNIIVVTHSYLTGGSQIEQRNGGYGDNSPQYVFDNLIKRYPNIKMIFCGHVGTHGYRTDTGLKGNTIYSFLNCYHDGQTNPVRLVEIDTKNGVIKTRVYCPSIGEDKKDGSTRTVTGVQWVPAAGTAAAR